MRDSEAAKMAGAGGEAGRIPPGAMVQ
jgi:hypothetical protein